jgi:hypothetical protein
LVIQAFNDRLVKPCLLPHIYEFRQPGQELFNTR